MPTPYSRTTMSEVQSLYEAGNYDQALKVLRAEPKQSAQYFYNLGTVSMKLDHPGEAVAYLEKANALSPHDAQILQNLQLARSALAHVVGTERLDPASSALESMADRVSMTEVRGALGMLALIVILCWMRAYLKTRTLRRTLFQPAGLIGLCGFGITVALYLTELLASSSPPAFLLERQAVRSGPGEQFLQLTQLEAGVKIRVLGSEGPEGSQDQGWKQVRYSQDSVGWVRASSLLLL
jgi:tetratricopeptide (TPR) repeat protein